MESPQVQQISIFFCDDELSFFAKTRSLSEIPIGTKKDNKR